MFVGMILALAASVDVPAATRTDFGVREIASLSGAASSRAPVSVYPIFDHRSVSRAGTSPGGRSIDISAIAAIGSAWGRVTSTYRSPQHNRRVGGVRNSFHLSSRAIDIARKSGVRHDAIAAAYRNAGYHLVESLDEGDHSHFAFGNSERRAAHQAPLQGSTGKSASGTQWKMVSAPR